MMLVCDGDGMKHLRKETMFKLDFPNTIDKFNLKDLCCDCQDLYLFGQGVGILSLSFNLGKTTFQNLSNIIFVLRHFETIIKQSDNIELTFHQFISKQILQGIALRRTDNKDSEDVGISDDYSGSKFKIYSIINTEKTDEQIHYSREKLLYEIGTGSPVDIVDGNHYLSPATAYYDELMKSAIRIFKNYTGLALRDSFIVIGHEVYDPESRDGKFNSWNKVYFSIYIYNLYIRYNVFRFNTIFNNNEIKTRDAFQKFINRYNMSHISFDFLPNILHRKIHEALGIDEEVAHFEKRLGSLATSIQEDQEKRQATLLGIVSLLTGLSSVSDIFTLLKKFRELTGLQPPLFYTLLVLLLLMIAIPVLAYLFPANAKKVRRWISEKVTK
jgi:hypothetical protein